MRVKYACGGSQVLCLHIPLYCSNLVSQTPFYKTATHVYKEVVVLHLHSSICHAEKSPSAFQNDTSFSSKSEIFINVVDPTKPEIH